MAQVDRKLLEKCIADAEKGGALRSQTALWEVVAAAYNKGLKGKKTPPCVPITPTVVRLRVTRDWQIKVKTQPGKSTGNPDAFKGVRPAGPRKSRREKFSANPQFAASFAAMKQRNATNGATSLNVLVDRIAGGSLKAAVKLNCHQCMGCENAVKFIRECKSYACPMWPFRPHQVEGDDDATAADPGEEKEVA